METAATVQLEENPDLQTRILYDGFREFYGFSGSWCGYRIQGGTRSLRDDIRYHLIHQLNKEAFYRSRIKVGIYFYSLPPWQGKINMDDTRSGIMVLIERPGMALMEKCADKYGVKMILTEFAEEQTRALL
jgi:hypothetical protein